MQKPLESMTREEMISHFKSRDYKGSQLQVIIDGIRYGLSPKYLKLFEDTSLSSENMEIMLEAMKEDCGEEAVCFLSRMDNEEKGYLILNALKQGVSLKEIQAVYGKDLLPAQLREKLLPLMQKERSIPEGISEKVEFLTEMLGELKEGMSRQSSFLDTIKEAMKENPHLFKAQEESTDMQETDFYYEELERQFREAREDAERLLSEQDALHERIAKLEAEKQSLLKKLQEKEEEAERIKLLQRENPGWKEMQGQSRGKEAEGRKTLKREPPKCISGFMNPQKLFPLFHRKPDLLQKLAGSLDAEQIKEVRLGIEDGLTREQLFLLADAKLDVEKIRELRMTMKILNERKDCI
ncbi:MAG: hypothetical protein J6C64_03460 [Lachnospiraceae bacterium]|nr:hypothetical protein [Lachnospiraceae bacterium]